MKCFTFGATGGVVFLTGVTWAIVRRYIQRPYRIRIKTKPEHAVILGVLAAIGVTGFLAEGFRIADTGMPSFEKWSFIGYPLALVFENMSNLDTWHQVMWVAHILTFVAFLVILPVTMLRHIFTSPLNMYLSEKDRPKGAMKAMPNLMETELESFGASQVADLTWKQLLDTDACTMCGRCTSVCPAHATGKPLVLVDTDKNYGPGDWDDARFTVRWAYNGDNHAAMKKHHRMAPAKKPVKKVAK